MSVEYVSTQIRRGLVADIPTLEEGELGLATDTKQLYIGTASGNVALVKAKKRYVAKLNFDGELAPIPTVIENTLGVTPVITRNIAGTFTFTATNALTVNKVIVTLSNIHNEPNDLIYTSAAGTSFNGDDSFAFYTFDSDGALADPDSVGDGATSGFITVEVYY
jgi:hypothetical protein